MISEELLEKFINKHIEEKQLDKSIEFFKIHKTPFYVFIDKDMNLNPSKINGNINNLIGVVGFSFDLQLNPKTITLSYIYIEKPYRKISNLRKLGNNLKELIINTGVKEVQIFTKPKLLNTFGNLFNFREEEILYVAEV